MKENERKCLKCGCFASEDPKVALYRFPKPGVTNIKRCELWAKYCFPDKQWYCVTFQKKLYAEHRMLCSKHFIWSSFIDFNTKKLHRHAAPEEQREKLETVPEEVIHLRDITNVPPLAMSTIKETPAGTSASSSNTLPNLEATIHKRKMSTIKETPAGTSASSSNTLPNLEATIHKRKMSTIKETPAGTSASSSNTLPNLEATIHKRKNLDPEKRKLYQKCRKYMKKASRLRNTLAKNKMKRGHMLEILSEDDSLKKLSKIITPTFALLLQGEIRNVKRKFKGRRWTREEKITALRIFKRSPTCYRLLRRMCCLPSQSTLKGLLANFELQTGVHEKILESTKEYIASQKPSDNAFVLMFDEMSIKKHLAYNKKLDQIDGFQDHGKYHGRSPVEATYALVFMLAGLRKKVKQPIAHYFSSAFVTADRLAVLIKQVLQACFDAGILIYATVCDMDGVNRRALTNMGASEHQPIIRIGNNDVVTLFDTPHLLKCFRNLFLKYDLKCPVNISSDSQSGLGLAKWSHIKDFYEIDNVNPNFVFAPSLTKDHLNPNTKQKMKVKLAGQVLSHSVAGGMYAKIADGQLSTQASTTANVVSNMDKLFDCLNSDSPDLRRGKPCSTNMSKTSPHLETFNKMKSFFSQIQFVGCRNIPPSIKGWLWTMNGVQKLWEAVSKKHPDIKSIATRRLQQDPLENLFGCIRANCGSNYNPTVGQFIGGLKTAMLTNLAHMSSSGNCESDNNVAIISQISKMLEAPNVPNETSGTAETPEAACSLVAELINATEPLVHQNIQEDSGELQACAYVCGFLIKKIHHKCSFCVKIFQVSEEESIHNFVSFKEYNDLKKSLNYASRPFIECVENCATVVNESLKAVKHKEDVKKLIMESMETHVNFDFLKECSKHVSTNKNYITKSVFHICANRYCILKNREYAEQSSMAALKRKIEILKHK